MGIADIGLSGTIGNVIYYKRGNKICMRSMPQKFKQTKATKARATEFGRASKLAASIRKQLVAVIPVNSDLKMQSRLVSAVFSWVSSLGGSPYRQTKMFQSIQNFEFSNQKRTMLERWNPRLQVNYPSDGPILLKIPSFIPNESIKAPTGTVAITCKLSVAICDAGRGAPLGRHNTVLEINYDNLPVAEQTITVNLPTPKESLIVIGMSLEYHIARNGYTTVNTLKTYMPSGIVYAMYK
jgi:hypothetical protein